MNPSRAARLTAIFMCFGFVCGGWSAHGQMTDAAPAVLPLVRIAIADLPDAPMMQMTAQSSSSSAQPQSPPSKGTKTDEQHPAGNDLKVAEKQRLLGIMPQFQLVSGGTAKPLTSGEKFDLALHTAIDPFHIGWAFVIGGGWGEVRGSNKSYGWGPAGYFKRVGANYADNVDGAIIGNAVLPSLLHQDPRYFRVGKGSFGHRFLSAALSTVICRGDNGKRQPNVSNVLGNFISGGISNLYYPKDQRGAKLTLENGLSVTLFGALGGQLLEFGPDINHLLSRHKKSSPAGGGSDPGAAATPSAH